MDDIGGPDAAAAAEVAIDLEEPAPASDPGQLLSLKDRDTFIVADSHGDIVGGADGLFSDDTRVLSRFRLLIGEKRPSKLSFGLSRDNADFTFNGANLALPPVGGKATPRGVIHVERKRCLWRGRLMERLRLTNFGLDEVMLPIAFEFAADFRDMFEVRGMQVAPCAGRRPRRAWPGGGWCANTSGWTAWRGGAWSPFPSRRGAWTAGGRSSCSAWRRASVSTSLSRPARATATPPRERFAQALRRRARGGARARAARRGQCRRRTGRSGPGWTSRGPTWRC